MKKSNISIIVLAVVLLPVEIALSYTSINIQDSLSVLTAESFNRNSIFSLDQLNWDYKAGDDTSWSSNQLTLKGWQPVSIKMGQGEVPKNWEGNGWFKTTFKIDSSLFGKEMGIEGRIYGAMEVYMNGELVGKAGAVGHDTDSEESIGFFVPVTFQWSESEKQQMAIRYSNHSYKSAWGEAASGPLLNFHTAEQALSIYNERIEEAEADSNFFMFLLGFYFVLILLHGFLYLFYREDRTNLIFSLLMLGAFLALLNTNSITFNDMNPRLFVRYLQFEGILLAMVFCPLSVLLIHHLVYKKMQLLTWAFIGTGGAIGIIFLFNPFGLRWLYSLLFVIAQIEIIRCLIAGLFKGNKQLWIIAVGFLISIIVGIPRILFIATTGFLEILWYDWLIGPFVGLSFIPLSFSVYLAYDFSQLHHRVQRQLEENERLAEENIRKEREKKELIEQQRDELEKEVVKRTEDLEQSLKDLQAAQGQLVQQEKLASLGQLTAGIAHEIKNPLNFVNNFSDLSVELVEEVKEELSAFKRQSGSGEPISEMSNLLDNIEANLKKINEHGNRADGIVKSMLQHSRGGDGEMESTDLNALVEEYVNLAFHGMRASEYPINVDIEMDLDEEIGEMPLIAEDFSRVIINLCNNAFDAMRQKLDGGGQKAESYVPKLSVKTYQNNGNVTIEIVDNGPGIPEEVKDKILQPFFTTKKGSEGTGLGLSITNDIVKAHGGTISITSKENVSTLICIQL